MRILVFGSRDFDDDDIVFKTLEALLGWSTEDRGMIIIEGGATGADRLGALVATFYNTDHETYKADWDKYGYAAGMVRNKQMLDSGLDLAYGFINKPLEQSKGSYGMAEMLRKAKVKTYIIREYK